MLDDGVWTETSAEQLLLEGRLLQFLAPFAEEPIRDDDDRLQLRRDEHIAYLQSSMGQLPAGFVALDANRTWMCYWLVHSLALLEAPLPDGLATSDVAEFLNLCQDPDGGFAGGPGHLAHLAPTYSAVVALVTLGGEDTLRLVDRSKLQGFLRRMAMPAAQGGGFQLCQGGEVDVRGCYTAMAVAHLLHLDKASLAEQSGMVDYIRRCQTYEGGLGAAPGNEAHGGYTFCGLAALILLGRADVLDLPRLLHWAVCRQGAVEGGFMGRTNKLVDGCYSFWQAAIFPLLHRLQPEVLRQAGHPRPSRALLRSAFHTLASLAGAPARLAGGAIHRIASLGRGRGKPASAQNNNAGDVKGDGPGVDVAGAGAGGDGGRASVDSVDGGDQAGRRRKLRASVIVVPELPTGIAVPPVAQTSNEEAALIARLSAASICTRVELLTPCANGGEACDGPEGGEGQDGPTKEACAAGTGEGDAVMLDVCGSWSQVNACGGPSGDEEGASEDGLDDEEAEAQPLFNAEALQLWLLACCQLNKGGMRDKPGKARDFYHTCYCLSGLSICQHYSGLLLGGPSNLLAPSDPVCNVVESRLAEAHAFFAAQPKVK